MRARLADAGWAEVPEAEGADVVVVNTCTVTARADQEARQLVRSIARRAPGAKIVVTGCYAQRAPGEVAAIAGVSAVVGMAERERIEEYVGSLPAAPVPIPLLVGPARPKRPLAPSSPVHFGRTRALLKIQDGCDAFCTYCVVPYVRGRSRSLPLDEALRQGSRLLEAGFHEIVLTGADLGSYGADLGEPALLPRLVERLLRLGPSHRVRVSSIEPDKVPPALVEMIGTEDRLCPHLHLPLQSGSDTILTAMRRRYRARDYAALLARVAARGTVGIGADVIVGFPGEGAGEFEATRRFIADLPLAYLHVFRYSPRPGTKAASIPAPAASRDRAEALRGLGDAKRRAFFRSLVGTTRPVLAEAYPSAESVRGRSDVHAPVLVRGAAPWTGIARVALREASDEGCAGDLASR
jgi:threonylcarbamoyladenosine tRNA methylthiotransferase MtaB